MIDHGWLVGSLLSLAFSDSNSIHPHYCTTLQLCINLVSPLLKQSLQVCLPALQQVYKLEQIRQSPIFVYFVFQLQLKNVINDYELIIDC